MTNADEVKARMAEILREKENNKPMSAFEKETLDLKKKELESKNAEAEIRRADAAKKAATKSSNLMKSIDKCLKKADSLIDKLNGEKDVEEMTEQEIRKSILNDIKDWKSAVEEIEKSKDKIDQEATEIELSVSDQETVETLETKCQEAAELFDS